MTEATEDASNNRQEGSAWQTLAPVIDLVTPMAVRATATLRVADMMANGPVPIDELARLSASNSDALGRLLRHLVCHGVFVEPSPGEFGLNDVAALLRSDHPSGMQVSLDLNGFGGQMDLAFTGLLHTLRTGLPAWETVFGTPFWQFLAANPAMSASFDATMSAGPEYVADAVGGDNWSRADHVVDIGGGAGRLLGALLALHPQMRGTLVDLPDTVERGREYLAGLGLDERCTFVGQSFFEALPSGGDLYVLSNVLHDWADDKATAILRRCAEAAGDSGRVVVIEDGDSAMVAEMDLRMLVLCGGRQHSVNDYTALAGAAGLALANSHLTPLGQVIIEYTRAS